ncbi:hypothetical protein EB077_12295, partial [bacterium]|nr:hypothetical protein [bacterium]
LADNNAGLISARDVRQNMLDIIESLKYIVSSGDFDAAHPFVKDVRVKVNDSDPSNIDGGMLIVESGVQFANAVGNNRIQIEPYPGSTGIQHNGLAGLTIGDPHTQYLKLTGQRNMDANLGMGGPNNWINASGISMTNKMHGISFRYIDADEEIMHVGSGTTIKFDVDSSMMPTAKGSAQAWIRFNGSGNMQVLSSYNVTKLQRPLGPTSPGKFKIFFKPNTFADGNYVAVATSNARSDNDSGEDFSNNTVGIVERTKDYITFQVLNEAGAFVDAAVNDLVIFGNASGVIPSTGVTIENNPS